MQNPLFVCFSFADHCSFFFRFCHGTCPSYFIPRMNSKMLKAKFKSCAACAPRDYDAVDVTLDCPGQDPPQVTKTIVKIKKCECIDLDLSTHFRL
ncbi:hypothetical protein ANCCAN_24511 [Ancylostoma caninum]|uniref:DAN domain-containing protein n=1 Tax=Ancylostoma caninum TaxID=29170 RepID=A0A368FC32_ANCCA|nr:hypothetical protein ANCCAN_24511 [Ancylostoma caninum]